MSHDEDPARCTKMCDPMYRLMIQCKERCKDYYAHYATILLRRKDLYYCKDNTEPCGPLCDPSQGTSLDCLHNCLGYVQSHYGTTIEEATKEYDITFIIGYILAGFILAGLLFFLYKCVMKCKAYYNKRAQKKSSDVELDEPRQDEDSSEVEESGSYSSETPQTQLPLLSALLSSEPDSGNSSILEGPDRSAPSTSSALSQEAICDHNNSHNTHREQLPIVKSQTGGRVNTTNSSDSYMSSDTTMSEEVEMVNGSSLQESQSMSTVSITMPQETATRTESNDESTRCKELVSEPTIPSTNQSSLVSVFESSHHSNMSTAPPVVSLTDQPSNTLDEVDGEFFVWEMLLSQPGADGGRYRISTADLEYILRQPWARIVLRAEERIEIIVQGISVEDARLNVQENTRLPLPRFCVTSWFGETHQYLNGGSKRQISKLVYFLGKGHSNIKKTTMSSTIGGFLINDTKFVTYMLTSAHNSCVGTEYFSDPRMRPEDRIGTCQYFFLDDQFDIACIRVEHVPEDQLNNIISIPCGPSGTPMEFMPQVFQHNLAGLADRGVGLLKHSSTLVRGKLADLFVNGRPMHAMIGQIGQSNMCQLGDSGSPITCAPGQDTKGQLPALGFLSGCTTLIRRAGNRYFVTEACIFTPLWPALQLIAHKSGEDPTSYRFYDGLSKASEPKSSLTTLTEDSGCP